MKTNIAEALELKRVKYVGKYNVSQDEITGKYSAILDNADLGFVLTSDSKEKLQEIIKRAINLHCAMVSIDNVEKALFYKSNSGNKTSKPACNVLVPAF